LHGIDVGWRTPLGPLVEAGLIRVLRTFGCINVDMLFSLRGCQT
jgi:hypothetical protein